MAFSPLVAAETHNIPISEAYFQGAISIEPVEDGLKPWRVEYRDRDLLQPFGEILWWAQCPSGVRLRFWYSGGQLGLNLVPRDKGGPRLFDLVKDNKLLETGSLAPGQETFLYQTRLDAGVYEIWLSHRDPMVIRSFVISGKELRPEPDHRIRWLTYGSSITHCIAADSPAQTWPAVAAREMDVNLISMGLSGNCHLESLIASYIRDQQADIMTLKLGINVYGVESMNARAFEPAVIGLVKTIREKNPLAPIALITPIIAPLREETENSLGMTLEDYRECVRDAFQCLKTANPGENLFLFEGKNLFGEDDVSMLPDSLHPDAEGYRVLGSRVAALVLPKLLPQTRVTK